MSGVHERDKWCLEFKRQPYINSIISKSRISLAINPCNICPDFIRNALSTTSL